MCSSWDSLFNTGFNRERAEDLHQKYRKSGSDVDLEACFTAYVPLAGAIFRRKGLHRQDYDDAFSSVSHGLWKRLQNPAIENISGYLNVYLGKCALNFMRTHPLYSDRLNPRPDGKPLPKRQISIPDALHLEETISRVPEIIFEECEKNVRHGGIFRAAVLDAAKCCAMGGDPSPVLLDKKHGVGLIHAAKLVIVATVMVRQAKRKLRSTLSGMKFYDPVRMT